VTDTLQHLLDRIRREAVEAGEKQASEIVLRAREHAASLVREAEDKARAIVEKAERDADVFAVRGRERVAQACRDLLIAVGQGVENIVAKLADVAVDEALRPDVIEQMIVKMAEAYVARGGRERRLEVLLSPQDQEVLLRAMRERYHDAMASGIEIRVGDIGKGFRVSFAGEKAYHDFSKEAIAEALAHFLRPHLAEIVHRVAHEGTATASRPR
jgi:V/A-type H+-transporting ATPase subunit E